MSHFRVALALAIAVVAAGCSRIDDRCRTLGNPTECAAVVRAGGRFEDYQRYGLGGYRIAKGFGTAAHLTRPAMFIGAAIPSYDAAIRRWERREQQRRIDRQRRQLKQKVKRARNARASHHR